MQQLINFVLVNNLHTPSLYFKGKLDDAVSEKAAMEAQLKKDIEDLQGRLSQLDSDKQAGEKRLQEDLSQLHRDLIGN